MAFAAHKSNAQENIRILPYRGQNWRIPTPSGLYDLESLSNATLPQDEIFKALAFNLTPGTVCFTNYSGEGPWPANAVPTRACLDIRPAADSPPQNGRMQVPPSGAATSALAPELFKKFMHYLREKKVPLDDMISNEINDRVSLDLMLINMHSPTAAQTLSVDFNINHGTLINDSLHLSYRLRSAAWDITLSYALPLEGQSITSAELTQKILLLEQRVGTWLQTFCALNALEIPKPVWLWTKAP